MNGLTCVYVYYLFFPLNALVLNWTIIIEKNFSRLWKKKTAYKKKSILNGHCGENGMFILGAIEWKC
jgi:hypothetical protein